MPPTEPSTGSGPGKLASGPGPGKLASGSGPGKLAFVTPRYGAGVVGGSESVMREAARGLAERGFEVEVLTTCATNHYTWDNEEPAGSFVDGRLLVRRFPTVPGSDLALWMQLQGRVMAGERLDAREELSWVNGRFRVPELYLHLAARAADYSAVVFSPYLFWSTLYCIDLVAGRSILMPCLHDEPYAKLSCVRAALAGSAAVWFLSEPEHSLGHRLGPLPVHHPVVGAAVDVPASYDPSGFRERHGLERPFVLFAGRREDGKGAGEALRGFAAAIVRHRLPLDLVTIGVGEAKIPRGLESRVVDLGYLEPDEVPDAFAAADAYLQPSVNESFSRTIMESWLAGTVVVANGASEVVSWHCERSGGGLLYRDELELGECLRVVSESPKLADDLARQGRQYVLDNYTWASVLSEMETSLGTLL